MSIISKMLERLSNMPKRLRERWNNYRALKYAYGISLYAYRILDLRARLQFSLPRPGRDETVDHNIDDARKFFIFGRDIAADTENPLSAKSREIFRWLCSDTDAENCRALYLRAVHFERTAANKLFADLSARPYQDLYGTKLESRDVSMLRKEYRKEYVALVKRFRVARRALTWLVNFTLKDFALIASMPPAVFAIFGYVYISIVYGYFGIDASQFFTLGDYLASSINQIWLPLSAIAGYLVFAASMYQRGLEFKTKFPIHTFRKFPIPRLRLLAFVSIDGRLGFSLGLGIFGLLLRLFYTLGGGGFWYLITLITMSFLVLYTWVARGVSRVITWFFKNPFHMHPATRFTILFSLFFAGIVFQSVEQIANIKDERGQTTFVIETVNQRQPFTEKKFDFLGGNERYIFLLNKARKREAEIIPLEEIKNMQMFKKTWALRLTSSFQRARRFLRSLPGKTGAVCCW